MDLPFETWREVATYLDGDAASVASLACSCRSARDAIEGHGTLWKGLLERDFTPVGSVLEEEAAPWLDGGTHTHQHSKKKRNTNEDLFAFHWRECYRSWAVGRPRNETVNRAREPAFSLAGSRRVNALVLDEPQHQLNGEEKERRAGGGQGVASCWSAGADGMVKRWDIARGEATARGRLADTETHGGLRSVECAASCGPGLLVTGGADKAIALWDSRATGVLMSRMVHYDEVLSIACSTSGKIVSGGADDCVKVWDMRWMDNALLELDTLHGGSVFCIAIDEAKQRVYTGSGDKTISLWDLSLGHWVAQAHAHTGDVYDVCSLSSPRSGALTCSSDGTVREWKVEGKDEWFNELQNVATLDLSTPLTCLEMLGGEERSFLAGTWNGDVILGNLSGGKKPFSRPIPKNEKEEEHGQGNSPVTAITGTYDCVVTGFDNGAVSFSRMSTRAGGRSGCSAINKNVYSF